jgi:uncharacterized NAD(P)/FAD-binding protein YdhS
MTSRRQDTEQRPLRVAVIGGGLSGSLCAMRIAMLAGHRVHITLVERRSPQLHRGVAYSATLSQQLLNVPAGNMSLFPERPTDLLEYIATELPQVGAEDFLPRDRYGAYVAQRFREVFPAERADGLTVVPAAAVALVRAERGYGVQLDNGDRLTADVVVLALGNAPPAHVPGLTPAALAHPGYIDWPWRHGVLGAIAPDDPVFFAGAGLTMTDLLLSLDDQGHRGPVIVVSRNGRLPLPHAPRAPYTPRQPMPEAPYIVLDLMRWLRREAALSAADGVPWQQLMDHVKPYVRTWWQGMDAGERARFLRHARPFWEVHRHRMPRDVRDRLVTMVHSGRVRLWAGRVVEVAPEGELLRVVVRGRAAPRPTTVRVRHLVNCTGPQADTRRLDQPLIADMLARGLATWDALHLGLATDAIGAVIDVEGRPSPDLFAVGPLCKATLWECTAVPEIRVQARALAERIAAMLPAQQGERPA